MRIRCAGCAIVVYFCESDYHDTIYCGEACRGNAARASKARHQASRGGRFDHAARNVAYRARRRASMKQRKFVTDTRSSNLPGKASSCPRGDASASMMETHAVAVESTDDGTIDSDDAAFTARDAAPRNGGETRSDAGRSGSSDGESSARRGDASGGVIAVASTGDVGCVVCGRRGQFIRDADVRRSRVRDKNRALPRRGRIPRLPSAKPPNSRLWQLR